MPGQSARPRLARLELADLVQVALPVLVIVAVAGALQVPLWWLPVLVAAWCAGVVLGLVQWPHTGHHRDAAGASVAPEPLSWGELS